MAVTAENTKIGVLGTGDVGNTLARGFAERGFAVKIGTRDPLASKVRKNLADCAARVLCT
jgi:predicted dinucleotide-binding enzyme